MKRRTQICVRRFILLIISFFQYPELSLLLPSNRISNRTNLDSK